MAAYCGLTPMQSVSIGSLLEMWNSSPSLNQTLYFSVFYADVKEYCILSNTMNWNLLAHSQSWGLINQISQCWYLLRIFFLYQLMAEWEGERGLISIFTMVHGIITWKILPLNNVIMINSTQVLNGRNIQATVICIFKIPLWFIVPYIVLYSRKKEPPNILLSIQNYWNYSFL